MFVSALDLEVIMGIMWGNLLHLGFNMWGESDCFKWDKYIDASPVLRFDKETWDEILEQMVRVGMNTVVIDLGEGVKYESHPEIAVQGSWEVEQLKKELEKMRKMGLKPIPKLNFSAGHDEWLGEYSRCVSSKIYYQVCKDLINEVIEIFDTPELFHIGMDEETYSHQRFNKHAVVRNGDLWWNDLYFFVDLIEKKGVRAWVWSDYMWSHEDEYIKKMPKSVLQSNWYYSTFFEKANKEEAVGIRAYRILEENGFDQVPTGSNWCRAHNFEETVDFCTKNIGKERLKGFLQTPWMPTVKERKYRHFEAVDLVRQAKGTVK
jgi:hypothetical protein